MYRLAIAGFVLAIAAQTAAADVADLFSSATWSFSSSNVSDAVDAAFSDGGQTSFLSFNLSAIPVGATINSATFSILDVSTNWNFGNNFQNEFGCGPFLGPLPFFGEADGCTDLFSPIEHTGAEYLDQVFVDGSLPTNPACPGLQGSCAPGPIDLIGVQGLGTPDPVDPSTVTGGGVYTVPINITGYMEFGAFDDFGNAVPPVPVFSVFGGTDAELVVNFSGGQTSVAPEPASYSALLAALLIPLAGIAIYRRRAAARH